MNQSDIDGLGPLKPFVGTWEGSRGIDLAPDDDRTGVERNEFRERVVLEPIGLVENHEQQLYGLRYAKMAWRLGADSPFHEEVGYFLWDAQASQVMLSFNVPRGITVLAGGDVAADASRFTLAADVGSDTFGICSGPFLDREFKTVHYEIELSTQGDEFTYKENTQLRIVGRDALFDHIDENTLSRV